MQDLMVDLETMDTGPYSTIVQIGACYFDRYTGDVDDTFLINIDMQSSMMHDFTTSDETIKWWSKQERTFLNNIRPVDQALKEFAEFSLDAKNIWCHATFDFPILMNAYKLLNLPQPFHYTQARDIRTLDDLAGVGRISTVNPKTHNALDDCLHQVEYCTDYFNELRK